MYFLAGKSFYGYAFFAALSRAIKVGKEAVNVEKKKIRCGDSYYRKKKEETLLKTKEFKNRFER